jgi:hypothetical protein
MRIFIAVIVFVYLGCDSGSAQVPTDKDVVLILSEAQVKKTEYATLVSKERSVRCPKLPEKKRSQCFQAFDRLLAKVLVDKRLLEDIKQKVLDYTREDKITVDMANKISTEFPMRLGD